MATMYGFEALSEDVWAMDHAGEQNRSNYFSTREQAEAELPRLAQALECDVSEVRATSSATPDRPAGASQQASLEYFAMLGLFLLRDSYVVLD
jgi:hypothetical protein